MANVRNIDTHRDAMAAWIREALARTGKSQSALARALGLDPSQGNRLASGARQLKAAEIPLVERFLETRLPQPLTASDDENAPAPPASVDGFVAVPVFDIKASAGSGAVAFDAEPVDFLMFRETWLRRAAMGLKKLFVLEITGDSNWPFLHDGDHALVDANQVNPRREGRYVIRIDDVLQVKLVSMHPVSRRLVLKADNPAYPSYDDLDPEEISIVGRVIWIGRSLG